MKRKILLFATLLLIILPTGNACANWLIYHKPAFEGKVIDAELLVNVKNATSKQVMHLFQDMSVPEHARGGLI